MSPIQLREVAMITTEIDVLGGSELFFIDDNAENLYLLETGSVEIRYVVLDKNLPHLRKDFLVGVINPGDIFGISALIEPYVMGATAKAVEDSRVLQIHAAELRRLSEDDPSLGCGLQKAVAKVTMSRLDHTRILLAGASSPLN